MALFDWRGARAASIVRGRLVNDFQALLIANGRRWSLLSLLDGRWRRGRGALPLGATHFSPSMSRAAVPTADSFEIWDVRSHRLLSTLRDPAFTPNGEDRLAGAPLIFSRDGSRVWAVGAYKSYYPSVSDEGITHNAWTNMAPLRMWDALSGRKLREVPLDAEQGIQKIELSADERTLVVDTSRGPGRVVRLSPWREVPLGSSPRGQELMGPYALSPDGKYLASAARPSLDSNTVLQSTIVWLWALRGSSASRVRSSPPGPDHLSGLALSRDGRWLLASSPSRNYRWDVASRKRVRSWPLGQPEPAGAEVAPGLNPDAQVGTWVQAGSNIQLREQGSGRLLCAYQSQAGEPFTARTLLSRPNGKSLVLVTFLRTRTLWKATVEVIAYDPAQQSARMAQRFDVPEAAGPAMLSPDGRLLFAQVRSRGPHSDPFATALAAYDLEQGRLVATLPPYDSEWSVLSSEDGSVVSYANRLWNLRSGRPIAGDAPQDIARDGRAALIRDRNLMQLFDVPSRRVSRAWRLDAFEPGFGFDDNAPLAAFSPDGSTAYIAHGGLIYAADTRSGHASIAFDVPALK